MYNAVPRSSRGGYTDVPREDMIEEDRKDESDSDTQNKAIIVNTGRMG